MSRNVHLWQEQTCTNAWVVEIQNQHLSAWRELLFVSLPKDSIVKRTTPRNEQDLALLRACCLEERLFLSGFRPCHHLLIWHPWIDSHMRYGDGDVWCGLSATTINALKKRLPHIRIRSPKFSSNLPYCITIEMRHVLENGALRAAL